MSIKKKIYKQDREICEHFGLPTEVYEIAKILAFFILKSNEVTNAFFEVKTHALDG